MFKRTIFLTLVNSGVGGPLRKSLRTVVDVSYGAHFSIAPSLFCTLIIDCHLCYTPSKTTFYNEFHALGNVGLDISKIAREDFLLTSTTISPCPGLYAEKNRT